uniref:Serpentine receptor class gamma n=1 Tax=Panagrellus redivivus TaxID=6233 RepID=A0A7E4V794_PANRE
MMYLTLSMIHWYTCTGYIICGASLLSTVCYAGIVYHYSSVHMHMFKQYLYHLAVVQITFSIANAAYLPMMIYPKHNIVSLGFLSSTNPVVFAIVGSVWLWMVFCYIDIGMNLFIQQCFQMANGLHTIPVVFTSYLLPGMAISNILAFVATVVIIFESGNDISVILDELKSEYMEAGVFDFLATSSLRIINFTPSVLAIGASVYGFYAASRISIFCIVVTLNYKYTYDERLPSITRKKNCTTFRIACAQMASGMLFCGATLMASTALFVFDVNFENKVGIHMVVFLISYAAPIGVSLTTLLAVRPYRLAVFGWFKGVRLSFRKNYQ